jgi:peptide/nickel transport system permease protein
VIRYVIERAVGAVVVLLVVTFGTFVLFGPLLQVRAGVDAARIVAGPKATKEAVEQTRRLLGLDRPWYEQYGKFLRRLVFGPTAADRERLCAPTEDCTARIGRLGTSFIRGQSVDRAIGQAVPVTLSLALFSAVPWLGVAIPLGILSALRRGGRLDRLVLSAVVMAQSLPVYFVGLVLLYVLAYLPSSQAFERWFGFRLSVLPIGGYARFDWSNPWPWLHHLILPTAVLSLQFLAVYTRLIRAMMIETMHEPFVRTARAKGASETRVVLRHGFRAVQLPLVTMVGLDLGLLAGGAVLTETTFGLPGLGRLTVMAAAALDIPLTMGIVLFSAACLLGMSMVVDITYALLDPRVRVGARR